MAKDDVAVITIKVGPKGSDITVNDAALRLGNARLAQAFRHTKKEIHRSKRAIAHKRNVAEQVAQRAQADKDALANPPAPRPVAKVETAKAKMPVTDPLKRTSEPPKVAPAIGVTQPAKVAAPSPLKKVAPKVTLTKQES